MKVLSIYITIWISICATVNAQQDFFQAAQQGNMQQVQTLLQKVDINVKDHENKTALIHAIQNGNTSVAKMLIEREIDMDVQDNAGKTAIIYAVQKKSIEICKKTCYCGSKCLLIRSYRTRCFVVCFFVWYTKFSRRSDY